MANAPTSATDGGEKKREPISPAKRRQLQQFFEHGNKVAASGQFDYATDMYIRCVSGDPGNPIYARHFLSNLQRKYSNNKKGASFASLKTTGARASLKKSVMQKDWPAVLVGGLEVLKVNPWDFGALSDIARACEELEYEECQLEYLKLAHEGDPSGVEPNRLYAKALANVGRFDESIECWQRVLKVKKEDEEARRAIANTTVEKTIHRGGYETAESSKDVRRRKLELDGAEQEANEVRLSLVERMEREIAADPAFVEKYVELADLHSREERFADAAEVLRRALQASGGDLRIRERLEDTELRYARQQLDSAERQAREERTEAAVKLYNRMRDELNAKELEVYVNRCERYPANQGFKFELAVRLQRARRYAEAIKLYQESRNDLKRKAQVYMALGQCFAHIKQFRLALQSFDQAAVEWGERDINHRKECIYNAAKLALHLKDYEVAEARFSELAGIDFGFKDVSAWLDKLARLREDGGELESASEDE